MIKWTDFELIVTAITGIIIGIVITLLLGMGCKETVITDHEVLIDNFLNHEELLVVRKDQ